MKTSELRGAALDWAVGQCEGIAIKQWDSDRLCFLTSWGHDFEPSSNWVQCNKIIEREEISMWSFDDVTWKAQVDVNNEAFESANPLVAAMRSYVASKLGDDVEVPTELTQGE